MIHNKEVHTAMGLLPHSSNASVDFKELLLKETPGDHSASPTLRFASGDVGWYENASGDLCAATNGTLAMAITDSQNIELLDNVYIGNATSSTLIRLTPGDEAGAEVSITGQLAVSSVASFDSTLEVTTDDGIDYVPGSDIDVDIATIFVGGTPKFTWDESETAFSFTTSLIVGNILRINGDDIYDSSAASWISSDGALNTTLAGALAVTSANGIDINPGSDIDTDLITVVVTGGPKFWWDESDSHLAVNIGFDVTDTSETAAFRVRHPNLTQGVGIGFSSLLKIATASNSHISLLAKGTSGQIWLGQDTPGTGIRIIPAATNNTLYFGNKVVSITADSGNKFHIGQTSAAATGLTVDTTNGYVGILDSSPSFPLDITGAVRTTSYLQTDGDAIYDSSAASWISSDGSLNTTFGGDILLTTTNKANYRDSAIGIYSQADTFLDLFADGSVRIGDSAAGAPTNYVEIESDGDVNFVAGAGLQLGEISFIDNSTETTISVAGTKVQITDFDTNGVSNGSVTPDHTNDHITVGKAGFYLIIISVTVESVAGAGSSMSLDGYVNNGGTQLTNIHAHRSVAGGGTDVASISLSGTCDCSANDTIELWITNNTNTQNYIVEDCTISVIQIAGT